MCFVRVAAAEDGFDAWKSRIEEQSIVDLGESFTRVENRWPRLPSVGAIHQDSNSTILSEYLELTRQLLRKVRVGFHNTDKEGFPEMAKYVGSLLQIEGALLESGGYTNQVVASALAGAADLRLLDYLVDHQSDAGEVLALVRNLPRQDFNARRFLLALGTNDAAVSEMVLGADELVEDASVFQVLELLGQNGGQRRKEVDQGTTTRELIESPSALVLFLRKAEIELALSCLLPGLSEFYERGGTEADLNPGDVRAFKAIMGDRVSAFRFQPMRVTKLDPLRLKSYISIVVSERSLENALRELLD